MLSFTKLIDQIKAVEMKLAGACKMHTEFYIEKFKGSRCLTKPRRG